MYHVSYYSVFSQVLTESVFMRPCICVSKLTQPTLKILSIEIRFQTLKQYTKGFKRCLFHLYTATGPYKRKYSEKRDKQECKH